MAEQIKSFWTHLCAMIGAIFGILISGTAVTIKSANAADCDPSGRGNVESIRKKVTLDNGAVVDYLYGSYSAKWMTYSGGEGNCLRIPDSTVTKNRYYVFFVAAQMAFILPSGLTLLPILHVQWQTTPQRLAVYPQPPKH